MNTKKVVKGKHAIGQEVPAKVKEQKENSLTVSQQESLSALRQKGNGVLPYEVGMGKAGNYFKTVGESVLTKNQQESLSALRQKSGFIACEPGFGKTEFFSKYKAAYYSQMAKVESVDFVKARYEEKADYWTRVAEGKEIPKELGERCALGHKMTAADSFVNARHMYDIASSEEKPVWKVKMGYWEKEAREEMKTNNLVKVLSKPESELSVEREEESYSY